MPLFQYAECSNRCISENSSNRIIIFGLHPKNFASALSAVCLLGFVEMESAITQFKATSKRFKQIMADISLKT